MMFDSSWDVGYPRQFENVTESEHDSAEDEISLIENIETNQLEVEQNYYFKDVHCAVLLKVLITLVLINLIFSPDEIPQWLKEHPWTGSFIKIILMILTMSLTFNEGYNEYEKKAIPFLSRLIIGCILAVIMFPMLQILSIIFGFLFYGLKLFGLLLKPSNDFFETEAFICCEEISFLVIRIYGRDFFSSFEWLTSFNYLCFDLFILTLYVYFRITHLLIHRLPSNTSSRAIDIIFINFSLINDIVNLFLRIFLVMQACDRSYEIFQ